MAGALNHQHHMNILSLRHGVKGQRAIGDYIVTRQIGSGSFAVVWKGYHKQHPGFDVAIKEIATERLNRKLQESLRREIAILQRIDHPNIIKLHDIVEVSIIFGRSIDYVWLVADGLQVVILFLWGHLTLSIRVVEFWFSWELARFWGRWEVFTGARQDTSCIGVLRRWWFGCLHPAAWQGYWSSCTPLHAAAG